ncbi:MAG: DNA polymerase III subunit delta' [Planifilum sp.]
MSIIEAEVAAMSFEAIRGQEKAVRLIRAGLKRGRVAHAYLFSGPRGVGKRAAALALAKALNCPSAPPDACCDRCHTCRRIENGNHPDVVRIAPDGASIKIDQVRRLQREFAYAAAEADYRVVLIEQVEAMTVEAANSMLKFLEEPVTPMVAVLIAEQEDAVLPTIRSRCQRIRFAPLLPEHLEASLTREGVDPAMARIAAHVAGGLDEARRLVERDGFARLCEQVIKWSGEVLAGRGNALVSLQTEWMKGNPDRNALETVLELMLLWLRDLLNRRLGRTDQEIFTPWANELSRQSAGWTPSRLVQVMDCVIQARRQLNGPMQPQSVLEQMVLAIQEGSLHARSDRSPLSTSG